MIKTYYRDYKSLIAKLLLETNCYVSFVREITWHQVKE